MRVGRAEYQSNAHYTAMAGHRRTFVATRASLYGSWANAWVVGRVCGLRGTLACVTRRGAVGAGCGGQKKSPPMLAGYVLRI